jgi:hypothetical protein
MEVVVVATNRTPSTRTTRNKIDHLVVNNNKNTATSNASASTSTRKSMTTGRLIESMSEIVKSPYEGIECAEVGEDCFDKLKNMLEPVPGGDPSSSDQINPKINSLFGDVLACTLYNAYHEIGHSGMLFSANWREGKIRNRNLGWIPKRQLLLCLREHRFAKADVSLLQAVIKNLDCVELVIETMKTYNLSYDYPNLASNTNTNTKDKAFIFDTQKVRCLKCMIFVARSFACMQNLNTTHEISSSLTKNIKACLSIMNNHVRPNQKGLTKLTLKINKKIASSKKTKKAGPKTTGLPIVEQSESSSSSDQQVSAKRHSTNISSSSRTCGVVVNREANTSCRPRKKVRKDNETPESLLVSFNIMREQVQRLNQMMDFFQTLLYEHRNDLRDEMSDTIMSESRDEDTDSGDDSDIDNTKSHGKNRRRTL